MYRCSSDLVALASVLACSACQVSAVEDTGVDCSSVINDQVYAEGFGWFSLRSYEEALSKMRERCSRLHSEIDERSRELQALGPDIRIPQEVEILVRHQGSIGRTIDAVIELASEVKGEVVHFMVETLERVDLRHCQKNIDSFVESGYAQPPCRTGPNRGALVTETDPPHLRLAYVMSVLAGACPASRVIIRVNSSVPSTALRGDEESALTDEKEKWLRLGREPRVFLAIPSFGARLRSFVCTHCVFDSGSHGIRMLRGAIGTHGPSVPRIVTHRE